METQVKLTKLASCAGCGAKMGAGTLAKMLEGFKAHSDPRLIVGYDKSDDASVYVLDENTALIQTTDFFPPIVDDPYLYGKIAATNALSDVYAMGGEPKLALNILCAAEGMADETIREVLRGGYDAAYEAGAIITGGHTIRGAEPIYGLAVSGFAIPGLAMVGAALVCVGLSVFTFYGCKAATKGLIVLTKKLVTSETAQRLGRLHNA